jgi:hypothetical protein
MIQQWSLLIKPSQTGTCPSSTLTRLSTSYYTARCSLWTMRGISMKLVQARRLPSPSLVAGKLGGESFIYKSTILFIFSFSTSGTIHVSYSFVHRKQPTLREQAEAFHTRQISYPVSVTVYHMLECHMMDILPYSTIDSPEHDNQPHLYQDRLSILHTGDGSDWCLLSIEVRNMYGLPFDVTFERTQQGEHLSLVSPHIP